MKLFDLLVNNLSFEEIRPYYMNDFFYVVQDADGDITISVDKPLFDHIRGIWFAGNDAYYDTFEEVADDCDTAIISLDKLMAALREKEIKENWT